jgi:hypothetical protein
MLDRSDKNNSHFTYGPNHMYVPPSMVIMTETGCVLCEVLANEEEKVQDLN